MSLETLGWPICILQIFFIVHADFTVKSVAIDLNMVKCVLHNEMCTFLLLELPLWRYFHSLDHQFCGVASEDVLWELPLLFTTY